MILPFGSHTTVTIQTEAQTKHTLEKRHRDKMLLGCNETSLDSRWLPAAALLMLAA